MQQLLDFWQRKQHHQVRPQKLLSPNLPVTVLWLNPFSPHPFPNTDLRNPEILGKVFLDSEVQEFHLLLSGIMPKNRTFWHIKVSHKMTVHQDSHSGLYKSVLPSGSFFFPYAGTREAKGFRLLTVPPDFSTHLTHAPNGIWLSSCFSAKDLQTRLFLTPSLELFALGSLMLLLSQFVVISAATEKQPHSPLLS